jgi:hypothetical protein
MSHRNVDSVQRKISTHVGGDRDLDQVRFDVIVNVAAGTAITPVLAAAQVPANRAVFIDSIDIVSDAAAWTGGTNIILQDTAGSPNAVVTVLTANLPTATTYVSSKLGSNTATWTRLVAAGLANGLGLQLAQTGTYSGAAVLTVRVTGTIRNRTSLI